MLIFCGKLKQTKLTLEISNLLDIDTLVLKVTAFTSDFCFVGTEPRMLSLNCSLGNAESLLKSYDDDEGPISF